MTTAIGLDSAIRAKHRAMWASGNYPTVAAELVAELGTELVAAAGIRAGDRVLDVAAGSGNAAIPAALAGGEVVASDLTPELFAAGRGEAERRGAHLSWEEADAEALPFPDASFDVVLSCIGVMFAPHHQASADELVRVCRPGGTIAVASWTPDGFIGRMFAAMKPYAPPPPPGAQPAPLWGDPDHVRALFGDRVQDFQAQRRTVRVDRFATGQEFREYFKANYGPTLAVYSTLEPDRAAELDDALDRLAAAELGAGGMDWEYLVVTARRASAGEP